MAEANFCRLCAEQKDSFVGIYEEEGLKLKLEYKIAKCLQIELCLKDPLPKTVCLDCCAKLNQCSDFFDTSAEAQVALYTLFRRPKEEERRISGNQFTETQPENFLCTLQTQESHQEGNNFCNDAAEKNLEHLPNRSPLLDNNSSDYYEGETEHSSRRKRRLPQRCSLELKIGTTDHEILSAPRAFCSPSSVTSTKCLQTEVAQESYDTMETEDKVCTEDIPDIDSLSYGHTSEHQNPAACKVMGETVHKTGDNAGANSRKRRDGWEKYPWMCTDCSLELPSMQALRSHHQTVHNQPPRFMCAQCSKVYTKYYGFVSHVRRHRNHMKFCCEECGKCFSNKKVLESHRATHSDARPFVCTECGKSFRQQSALYVHNRSHMPESIKNRYPCDQCDKRFSTKPNLVTHKRIHTGIRNFTCDQCGKSFIQKGNLDAHLLTHSADKPHICSVCNKGFKTPLQLRKHQSVHTGAKPHQCDVCGRQFRERGTLREHHRIHTGAMPFTCEFCGKSFRFKGILTTHRRQHTGERPYSCLECQHHFTNWPNYNKHMKRRHGINTSHQPDPNKIALANMAAVNTANTNSGILVTSSTSQTNPASATMLVLHPPHHLQTEHQQAPPAAPTEHCPSILGFPADAMEGAATGQFNNHVGTDTLSAHGAVCSVSDGDANLHVVERMGAHFYSAPSTAPPHVSAYSATAPSQANVLSFYALPHQLTGLESASIDLMPPVQQR